MRVRIVLKAFVFLCFCTTAFSSNVFAQRLDSIIVAPANSSVAVGSNVQFTATGIYSNGSTRDLTAESTWSSSNAGVATIAAGGVGITLSPGTDTITARSGRASGSTNLTVTASAPTLVSIGVSPATAYVALGYTQQFTATGNYSDGSTQDLTFVATWGSSNNAVATVSSGVASTAGAGSVAITATWGGLSGSATLTVSQVQLTSITVAPSAISVQPGSTEQFTATGTYTDGSTQDLTGAATWASSNNAVATIVGYGLAAAQSPGITTISASAGGSVGFTTLNVVSPSSSQTPTLVEHLSIAGSGSQTQPSIAFAMDPCLSGNLIVVPYTFASGTGVYSVSVTDDMGDVFSYALPQPGNDDQVQVTNIAYAQNCTPGASQITITFNGDTPTLVEAQASSFYNAGAFDGASANAGNNSTPTAGAFATSSNGDLIYNYVVQDTQMPANFIAGSQSAFLGVDLQSEAQQAAQYQIQGAAGVVNPFMTLTQPAGWNSVAVAFQAAQIGTAPSGMHIVHMLQEPIITNATSATLQFPSTGNLLAVSYTGNAGDGLSSITDSLGNVWGSCGGTGDGAVTDPNLTGGVAQIWYAGNTTTSTNLFLNVNLLNNVSGDVAFFYDIAGASSSPCDNQVTAYGDNSNNPGPLTSASVVPDTPNGLVLWTLSVDTNTVDGLTSPTGAIFDSVIQGNPQPDSTANQNDGWGHFYNPSTALLTFSVPAPQEDPGNDSMIYGGWVSIATAFEASTDPNAPLIGGLSATTGATGDTITITGANLASGQVYFNGTPGSVIDSSPAQINVTVPTGASTGNVVVTTSDGPSNGVFFTYIADDGC